MPFHVHGPIKTPVCLGVALEFNWQHGLQHQISHSCVCIQDEVIQKCSQGDIKITLLQLEVERIRFLIASYLRARVQKVSSS